MVRTTTLAWCAVASISPSKTCPERTRRVIAPEPNRTRQAAFATAAHGIYRMPPSRFVRPTVRIRYSRLLKQTHLPGGHGRPVRGPALCMPLLRELGTLGDGSCYEHAAPSSAHVLERAAFQQSHTNSEEQHEKGRTGVSRVPEGKSPLHARLAGNAAQRDPASSIQRQLPACQQSRK